MSKLSEFSTINLKMLVTCREVVFVYEKRDV